MLPGIVINIVNAALIVWECCAIVLATVMDTVPSHLATVTNEHISPLQNARVYKQTF